MGHFRANSCYFAPAVQAIQSLARTHKIHGFQTTRNINANGAHEFAVVSAVSLYYFNTNEPWYYCGLVFFKERMRGGPEKILKVFIFFFFFAETIKGTQTCFCSCLLRHNFQHPKYFWGASWNLLMCSPINLSVNCKSLCTLFLYIFSLLLWSPDHCLQFPKHLEDF